MMDQRVREIAEAAIMEVMKRPTFTFFECHAAGDRASGANTYRLADRMLQKHRRLGNIRQTAKRGVWEPVP